MAMAGRFLLPVLTPTLTGNTGEGWEVEIKQVQTQTWERIYRLGGDIMGGKDLPWE